LRNQTNDDFQSWFLLSNSSVHKQNAHPGERMGAAAAVVAAVSKEVAALEVALALVLVVV
jgi:hypothetical protein